MEKLDFYLWQRFIALIDGDTRLADVRRTLGISDSYVYKTTYELAERGLIETWKVGRDRFCKVTKKGEKIALHCKSLTSICDGL